jgi:hypothetical protein
MTTKPVSLRIDHGTVNARARRLLAHLEADALTQRRVKLQAAKAYLAVSNLLSAAEPALKSKSARDRDSWTAEIKRIEARLYELSRRGV